MRKYLALFFMVALAALVGCSSCAKRDTTDSPDHRSGLVILTDYATGVQYVGKYQYGLAVRVGMDGKPYSDAGEEVK